MLLNHPLSIVWNANHAETYKDLETKVSQWFWFQKHNLSISLKITEWFKNQGWPVIYIIHDVLCMWLSMFCNKILANPVNQVIFEWPFDHLVK